MSNGAHPAKLVTEEIDRYPSRISADGLNTFALVFQIRICGSTDNRASGIASTADIKSSRCIFQRLNQTAEPDRDVPRPICSVVSGVTYRLPASGAHLPGMAKEAA